MNEFIYKNKDIAVTTFIFIVSFIYYYVGCIELLSHGFYEKINIAFDLDQSWYFDMVGRDSVDWIYKVASDTRPLVIKHPFIYLYYYFGCILNNFGFSNNLSVIVLSQVFHSGSLVLSFFIFRNMGRSSLESSFLIFGLAGTSTYISTGLVLDSYSLVIFWISAIFLVLSRSIYRNIECPLWGRAFISIMAIGTTSYLIVLVVLMESALAARIKKNIFNGCFFKSIFKQLLRVFILGILLFCVVYFQIISDIIEDPVAVIKRVYWAVNRPGEKQGILQVISVFTVFSIISPRISYITLPGVESITMIDLRLMDFGYVGWGALIIMVLSISLKIKYKENRLFLIICFLWLGINAGFHTVYQYRGSLFLYSGHFVLAVWVIYSARLSNGIRNLKLVDILVVNIDKAIVFVLPVLIWVNNLYLYNNIIEIYN